MWYRTINTIDDNIQLPESIRTLREWHRQNCSPWHRLWSWEELWSLPGAVEVIVVSGRSVTPTGWILTRLENCLERMHLQEVVFPTLAGQNSRYTCTFESRCNKNQRSRFGPLSLLICICFTRPGNEKLPWRSIFMLTHSTSSWKMGGYWEVSMITCLRIPFHGKVAEWRESRPSETAEMWAIEVGRIVQGKTITGNFMKLSQYFARSSRY
jgi:hypothetical protein